MNSTIEGALAPVETFEELGLPRGLVTILRKRDITRPLPIQSSTIADALAGRDVSGKAPTGSGKTLAFALPMAATIARGSRGRPRGLILAPTRELASQIAEVLAPLLACRGLRVHAFYGGVGFGAQLESLRRGVDVAVACPGRLEDLMRRGSIRLSDVDMVVVDEADRMADMGFLPAVTRILDATPATRQTLLFSATLDGDVDVLTRRYQREPVRHDVEPGSGEANRVTHRFQSVGHEERPGICADLVEDQGPTVVFVRTKHGADRLAKQLIRRGIGAVALHGDRSQVQRDRALAGFREGKLRVLVATGVAARGIHVDEVACVVHYDLPADPKEYVHRSGRTARAGAEGSVVAFVLPGQEAAAAGIRDSLGLLLDGPDGGDLRARRPAPRRGADFRESPTVRRRRHRRGSGRAAASRPTGSRREGSLR